MIRTFGRSVVLTVSLALIAGCQSTNHVVDTLRIKQAESGLNSNATIYCSGAQLCEFERLNTTPIVDAQKHRVSEQALHQGIVRLEGSVFSPVNSMYLSVPPQQYELVIRFIPSLEIGQKHFMSFISLKPISAIPLKCTVIVPSTQAAVY